LKGIAKTSPPLRTRRDRDALWRAIKSGRVNVISSDHAPHRLSEKMCDDAPPGVPGIEIMLRLLLTQVDRGILTMHTLVRLLCEAPSDILGIEKGYIQPGRDADILLVDLAKERKVKPDEFYSKAKYSPFEGTKTTGDVDKVILRGEITFENGEVTVKRGYGRRVR
ncbi:MAG: dihydroorotase family protein, partial [Candidatus Hydrothermarchaeaceae archaeon]